MEENEVKPFIFKEDDIVYEKEKMYWLGYLLQTWSNKTLVTGKELSQLLDIKGVNHLLRNYKIYHTVDPMYVLLDCEDYLNIKIGKVNFSN